MSIVVGDVIEVYYEGMNEVRGLLNLSKDKAVQMRAWERIETSFINEEVIRGLITHRVKGGLSVDIGVKAFLPGSQVGLRPTKNLDALLGEQFRFKIINESAEEATSFFQDEFFLKKSVKS